jgi:assimilatory nitrate reductase catalytic subunit
MPWAAAKSAAWPTCFRATATSANAEHRAEVARLWGLPDVPATPGLTAVELFEAVHRGEIKALWIACTNPAQSLPDLARVHEALARCPFVVVQEVNPQTDTAAFADLLLPAAGWGEKEGTVTNSERRISRVRAAVRRPAKRAPTGPLPSILRSAWKARRPASGATLFRIRTSRASSTSTAPARLAATSTSAVSRMPCSSARAAAMAAARGRCDRHARLYADGLFPTPSGRALFQGRARIDRPPK